jgi:hypothetical protein
MLLLIVLLAGFLLGGHSVHRLMSASHRRAVRPHELDEQYRAVKIASLRHIRAHGTLNLAAVEHLTDGPAHTALRYLEQMERDGLVRAQGNRSTKGLFYTRA